MNCSGLYEISSICLFFVGHQLHVFWIDIDVWLSYVKMFSGGVNFTSNISHLCDINDWPLTFGSRAYFGCHLWLNRKALLVLNSCLCGILSLIVWFSLNFCLLWKNIAVSHCGGHQDHDCAGTLWCGGATAESKWSPYIGLLCAVFFKGGPTWRYCNTIYNYPKRWYAGKTVASWYRFRCFSCFRECIHMYA